MGPPDSEVYVKNLLTLKAVCNDLSIFLAPEKQEGPYWSGELTFLGIAINTTKQMFKSTY